MPKKENIEQLFDTIAPSYDRLNHILSFNADKSWRRKAVREIADQSGFLNILDVACGTGDLTIALAAKVSGHGAVTGIDLSENMLALCEEKLAAAGLSATLVRGDGEDLPYPPETFDRVSVAFGIRNFRQIDKGLSEMFRVLLPGGKLTVLELSVPKNAVLSSIYKLYFLKLLPSAARLFSGDKAAYNYLPDSVLHFPAPEDFCAMMAQAGFTGISHRPLTFGVCRIYTGTAEK